MSGLELWLALGIRLIGHLVYVQHWVKAYPNYDFDAFKATIGPQRCLFLFPILFAPFWGEPVYRGFLYKAFRGSYSMPLATLIVVGWAVLSLWSQYGYFGGTLITLTAFTVLQCYLREKSDSLWDCIWSHFAFYASSLFFSGALR